IDRDPNLQRSRIPGKLNTAISEIDLGLSCFDILQILGHDPECIRQMRRIAKHQAPAFERHEKPFVRIQSDAVCQIETAEHLASLFSQYSKSCISGINVKP